MIRVSGSLSTIVPRACRINFFVRLIMPCCLPAACTLILPVAVTLKRFLTLAFVFNLGISLSILMARPGSLCCQFPQARPLNPKEDPMVRLTIFIA